MGERTSELGPPQSESRKRDRIVAYVDGFNLYHAVDDLSKPHLKWFNIQTLLEQFIDPSNQEIVGIKYFTTYAPWKAQSFARHQVYVRALRALGCEVIFGKFYKTPMLCLNCGNRWTKPEEKRTDVAIGAHLVADAFKQDFDAALVVTADTDLVPAVEIVRNPPVGKQVFGVAPPKRGGKSADLRSVLSSWATISVINLERNLLPPSLPDGKGGTITRPPAYDPPANP